METILTFVLAALVSWAIERSADAVLNLLIEKLWRERNSKRPEKPAKPGEEI